MEIIMSTDVKIRISFIDIFEPLPDIRQAGKVKHSLRNGIF